MEIRQFENYLDKYMRALVDELLGANAPIEKALQTLVDAMAYSVQKTGGKRFRPQLVMAAAEAAGKQNSACIEKSIPFACAIEMVHAFSLIHDDLPCMDNDDFRRGMPTNHKQFGEATALLAGDALLSEAFSLIAREYAQEPVLALKLTKLLADATGARGMIGGQMIDILVKDFEQSGLEKLHSMKTGALIYASVVGGALVAGQEIAPAFKNYAQCLGLAFQVVDDLQDHDETTPEEASFPNILGKKESQELVNQLTSKGIQALAEFGENANKLRALLEFNAKRTT